MGTEERVPGELKSESEREALRRKAPASAMRVARTWLKHSASSLEYDDEQRSLHAAAAACFGIIDGVDTRASENARRTIRQRLRRGYGR